MYASVQERAASAAAAFVVVLLIVLALVTGLRVAGVAHEVPALVSVFLEPPRPPQPKPPRPRVRQVREAGAKGAPAPRNLRNKATPVVAPPPPLPPLILPPPVVVATQAGTGHAASNGASDRAGPGQGAGGFGNGTGGGGNGDEGLGEGSEPEQIHGHLSFSDLPKGLLAPGQEATVGVRYIVEVDGHVTGCRVDQTSGYAVLDALTCRMIEQRFRFRPARDRAQRPMRAPIEETHTWVMHREDKDR